MTIPNQGQVVSLRHEVWSVSKALPVGRKDGERVHKITLEGLGDDTLGRSIDVIWEREVAPKIIEATSLPSIHGVDSPDAFAAFLDAIRWSSASVIEGDSLQAPFRGGVQIEEYQLAPVVRAMRMPRVCLLIADDVGLGKTIEAGLVAQELIHSHRATKLLVVCPAHLQTKWADEMGQKFGLEFRIVDRDAIQQMRREYGPTINPWASFPRIITSIDYLKREHPRRLFEELLNRRGGSGGNKPWDLLILDEAHNAAPSGRGSYVRDSERTSLLRAISEHFEHRIFLTSTPHNGYRESFTGLLEMLDSLRFSRGTEINYDQLRSVTIRRLKQDIRLPDGSPRFPPRVVIPRDEATDPDLYVDLSTEEHGLLDLLDRYTASRQSSMTHSNERATQFILTLLKKRALSSPLALRESLVTHAETAGVREQLGIGEHLFRRLEAKVQEDWSDDDEKEESTNLATEQASRLLSELSEKERSWLDRMFQISDELRHRPDSKARALVNWITKHLRDGNRWNEERVIVFTEYRHTLEYLRNVLDREGMTDRIALIYGGMPEGERAQVNATFQAGPDETDVRILLATDAASEGADFQKHCRNIIHYEIPWNPMRLEQRNGRVDRHGQMADEVRIHHFVYRGREDSEFLKRIVEKVEAIRADLGSVGAVIAESMHEHALGHQVDIERIERRAKLSTAHRDLQILTDVDAQAEEMARALSEARTKLGVSEAAQIRLLAEALRLEGLDNSLQLLPDNTFLVEKVPATWRDCYRYESRNGNLTPLTFDRAAARDNARLGVAHLDHPLMRRAAATLRSQMWRSAQGDIGSSLNRVDVSRVPAQLCPHPVAVAWGRLLILGPEGNRLHEELIFVGAELRTSELRRIDYEVLQRIQEAAPMPWSGEPSKINGLISSHVNGLEQLLETRGNERSEELQDALSARGTLVEKQTRSLINERVTEVRKAISDWERKNTDRQLALFDEEREQLETDIHFLKMRLAALEEDRRSEPVRLRQLYTFREQKSYPVAIQILLPAKER